MTTPELPPLTRFRLTGDYVYPTEDDPNGGCCDYADVQVRERILCDRIAELEADAERYRWLAAKSHKDTAYDRYGNGAHWSIGFFAADGRHALDAAIDAAREAKP